MATIAASCVLLLCVLLFLLGVEIGARYAAPAPTTAAPGGPTVSERAPAPASSDAAASAVPASTAS
ncbi:hypothetical protein [Trinickia acidisoli]|uniref:hypothetical protein n=1 Tax=Trinickia acidisoli TaxID=2767482 RepID=UPI002852E4A0|nr:hypothetical protein [Trinickia acidisoli]